MSKSKLPKVAVLLAAYNGKQWIEEQVNSILIQQGVSVTLFISVDLSSDGTEQWVSELTDIHDNVVMLPYGKRFGSAAKNFYHLFKNLHLDGYDYISLSDQDDIWLDNKLISAVSEMISNDASCYASNLTCFVEEGKEWQLVKDHRQKSLDYLFQGASAGCTYVLNIDSAALVQKEFLREDNALDDFYSHDWLIYAITRSRGFFWYIDHNSYIRYRQHDKNVYGARTGISGALQKTFEVKSGYYRTSVMSIERFIAKSPAEIKVLNHVKKYHFFSRAKLIFSAFRFRRRALDSVALIFFILFGLF